MSNCVLWRLTAPERTTGGGRTSVIPLPPATRVQVRRLWPLANLNADRGREKKRSQSQRPTGRRGRSKRTLRQSSRGTEFELARHTIPELSQCRRTDRRRWFYVCTRGRFRCAARRVHGIGHGHEVGHKCIRLRHRHVLVPVPHDSGVARCAAVQRTISPDGATCLLGTEALNWEGLSANASQEVTDIHISTWVLHVIYVMAHCSSGKNESSREGRLEQSRRGRSRLPDFHTNMSSALRSE